MKRWIWGLSAVAVAAATFFYLPLAPHSPLCGIGNSVGGIILTRAYKEWLVANLEAFNVPYTSTGSIVLLTPRDWLLDPNEWILNSSLKAFLAVATIPNAGINPHLPGHVKQVAEAAEASGNRIRSRPCEVVRAVAIEGF